MNKNQTVGEWLRELGYKPAHEFGLPPLPEITDIRPMNPSFSKEGIWVEASRIKYYYSPKEENE